jgi:hypothetical protein
MSIEQSGNAVQISFDAAYNDAHGAAPDGQGPAKIAGNGTLQFKWEDSFKNSGTGRITRAGEDIVVSMKATRVVDSRRDKPRQGVVAGTLAIIRSGAVGFIDFHEKAFKLKMKFISFGWAALWDRASMRTRCGGPGLDPI